MVRLKTAFAALFCAAVSAFAQDVQRGQEVVVTASRFPETEDALGPGVQVIDRKQIEQSTAQTVVELLSQAAGIHARDSLGSPDFSIDLRGFGQTGDQNTLVLVDGVRYSEIDTTPAKWSGIPLVAVERIEIFRGDAAVLYGNGATAGVINIITRKASKSAREADGLLRVGSWETGDFQFLGSAGGETLGLSLAGGALDTANYRDNNELQQYGLLLDLRNVDGPHTVYLKAAWDQQDLRNPSLLTIPEFDVDPRQTAAPFDYSQRNAGRADLGGNLDLGFGELAGNFTWRKKTSDAFVFDFGSLVDIETEYVGFLPRLRLPWKAARMAQSLVVGFDLEKSDYDRNVSGSFFASQTTATQKVAAAYLRNRSQLADGTFLTLGGRTQRVTTKINDPFLAPVDQKLTPNAWDATLQQVLSPQWSAYVRASQGFRVAGVEETPFSSGPLQPQTSHGYELGAEWRGSAGRVRLTAYTININNEINFNPLAGLFGDNANLFPTRRRGVELEARGRIASPVEGFMTFAHNDATFREGVYGGVDVAGKRVPLVPRWQVSMGAAWRIGAATQLAGSFVYLDEQFLNNDFANALPQRIPSYGVLDLKLTHRIRDWILGLEVKNLLDRSYYTYGGADSLGTVKVFPAPERAWFASAEYRFR